MPTNLEIVQAAYAAFGRGDVAGLVQLMAADVEWHNPGPSGIAYFGVHRGPQAVAKNVFGFLAENFQFEVFEPLEFLSGRDKVVVLLRSEAVVPRTGQRLAQELVHVFWLADGKIVRFHDFQNSYALAQALC
jgi:uncharacterized protein